MDDIDPTAYVVDQQFLDRRNWPVADSSKANIFEAIEVLGRNHFGKAWSGNELRTTWWSEKEDRFRLHVSQMPNHPIKATAMDRKRARQLGISIEAWMQRGIDADRRRENEYIDWVRNKEQFQRLEWAANHFAQHCRDGRIGSYYRLAAGGKLLPMEPSDWNTEAVLQTFVARGGNVRTIHKQCADVYVFADMCDLEALGAVQPATQHSKKSAVNGERKRPGPAPDPDWPHAISKVKQDCIAAGYNVPLHRGEKAAIRDMLLNYMAAKGKDFSDDAAAKHAMKVIAQLPDR